MSSVPSAVLNQRAPLATTLPLGRLLRRMLVGARHVHAGPAPRSLWRAAALFGRQLSWLRELRRWHDGSIPSLHDAVKARPALGSALFRPYVNSQWTPRQRKFAIEGHYQLLDGPMRMLRLAPRERLTLATVRVGAAAIDVTLDAPSWFSHEGEQTLSLFSDTQRLYSVAFSLGSEAGVRVAYIGALQGLAGAEALDIYRDLTHTLHGLRPRELLLTAFRRVCEQAVVTRLLAVSDACHARRSDYFRRSTKVSTSYDAVWREHDGQLRADGFFELPVAVPRRAPESIPARKRSQYRRRYEMLDLLATDLGQALRARV
jgi:hypothetical protein